MLSNFWHTYFFNPIYNGLVFLIDIVPGGDIGIAIILMIALVKFALLPVSIKLIKTQKIMKDLDPQIKELKEKYKDNREQQYQEIAKLLKDANVNPFSTFLVFLQFPIFIAMYFAVSGSGNGGVAFPDINTDILYQIVSVPSEVSMHLFGYIDVTGSSLSLALLAGWMQYLQLSYVMSKIPPRDPNKPLDFKEELMHNMSRQMKVAAPILITFFSYFSALLALYFFVSSAIAILQEWYVRKRFN